MLKNKTIYWASVCLYIALTFLSFYCACYRLPVAVKYGINLLVFGWACIDFMIRPQWERGMFCLRFFTLFSFPYLLFWTWSVGIWISEFQSGAFILRGSQNILYMMTNIAFLCSAVYLFDVKAVLYTVIGMAMANGLVFVQVGLKSGFPRLIQEYFILLATFADETGNVIKKLELHDMVFGWGAVLLYYMIHKEKSWIEQVFGVAVSSFFFTLAFKRIAIPAIVAGAGLYYLLRNLKPRRLLRIARIAAVAAVLGTLFYLYLIKSGIFYQIAEELGVNLMSRDVLYSYYEDFYDISPTYLGQGVRFIYAYGTEHASDAIMVDAVHNVYLETFIECGFGCYLIWMLYELSFRIRRIEKRYGVKPAAGLMAMNFYVFFTFLTDNTSFYYPINVMYRMTIMVWCYEEMKKEGIYNSCLMSVDQLNQERGIKMLMKEGVR